jgi:plastocyanin
VSFHVQGRAKQRSVPTLSAVTLAVGLLALAGCGSSSNTTTTAASTASSASTTAPTTPASTASSTTTTTTTTTATTPASSSAAPAGALTLEANREGQLSFDKTSLSAKAGKVSIAFTNMSPLAHNLTVESSAGKIVGATPTFQDATKMLTLTLKAGTYKFFCSVPGHRQAGMEGTLTVS